MVVVVTAGPGFAAGCDVAAGPGVAADHDVAAICGVGLGGIASHDVSVPLLALSWPSPSPHSPPLPADLPRVINTSCLYR